MPCWLPVAFALLNLVSFAVPFCPVLDVLSAALSATMIAIGCYLCRKAQVR